MREYKEKEQMELQLTRLFCNQCGRELVVEDGIVKEGCFSVDYQFDYFSNKDGYIYSFDLCEDCFDKWIKGFQNPVNVMETKEFL